MPRRSFVFILILLQLLQLDVLLAASGVAVATIASSSSSSSLHRHPSKSSVLFCQQCSRQRATAFGYYDTEESAAAHARRCQLGEVAPTPCTNSTHTHCVVAWYRSAQSDEMTVTERRCGVAADNTGCTLYNTNRGAERTKRHLVYSTGQQQQQHRRRETSAFFEVCSKACAGEDCTSSAAGLSTLLALLLPLIYLA